MSRHGELTYLDVDRLDARAFRTRANDLTLALRCDVVQRLRGQAVGGY